MIFFLYLDIYIIMINDDINNIKPHLIILDMSNISIVQVMSDNEDLYCNPQSNVFLQARKQNKPPKKLNEKKKLFGKKPAPQPGSKPEKPRPAIPVSANQELGNLFKGGLTRPSELRKTTIPRREADSSNEKVESPVIDFRAHLKAVESPIKTEAENRISVTSDTDILPPLPSELNNDEGISNEQPDIQSPPVPKRSSKLSIRRRPVPIPTPNNNGSSNSQSENDPLQIEKQNEANLADSSDPPDELPEIFPNPPLVRYEVVIPRPKRRLLQEPSKAPVIPLNTFPVSISIKADTLPDYISDDTYPDGDCEEMYTENDIPFPEDTYPDGDCEEMYTENDIPFPEDTYPDGDCEEMYTENDIPFPEDMYPDGDCEEMYTENDIPFPEDTYPGDEMFTEDDLPPPTPPSLSPLYDAPKTLLFPRPPDQQIVCSTEEQIEDNDEAFYTDEVCDYPAFKQASHLKEVEPPRPPVPQYDNNEEDDEDIYEDAEFPLIQESCPVGDYNPELEECEDIYDDIGSCNVPSFESPTPPSLSPLYDAPKTLLFPRPPDQQIVCSTEEQIEDNDEAFYTDEVCDYPAFKQASHLKEVEPPRPPVPQYDNNEEDDEDIYEDAEFPLIQESCPVGDYNPELEECEDIYDDIGSCNVPSFESPTPVKIQPSPMVARQSSGPPSLVPPPSLPPPPQLPVSAPPPSAAATKQKQKGGLFGIFKKSKKKPSVDSHNSSDLSVNDNPAEEAQPSKQPLHEDEDDELYIDGEGCEYSDDDDEPIYEDQ